MKKNTEKIKWLAAGFLVAHIFLFCVMFRSPKKRWEQDSYDCAIVCGCRVKEDGVPSDTLKARVEKAVELWKEKKVLCVATMGLFSGDGAGCSARLLKNTVQKLLADYISICLTPFVM